MDKTILASPQVARTQNDSELYVVISNLLDNGRQAFRAMGVNAVTLWPSEGLSTQL
jgi:hypothetical protein